eukprot:295231-Pelagomonas_calceolata.AAC.1
MEVRCVGLCEEVHASEEAHPFNQAPNFACTLLGCMRATMLNLRRLSRVHGKHSGSAYLRYCKCSLLDEMIIKA